VATAVVAVFVLLFRQGVKADRLEEMGNADQHYTWRDSPYLGELLNRAVKALFWTPSNDPTNLPPAIAHYLQHETMAAFTIDGFVQAVRAECQPGERIFGEYSLGPFAASVSDCVLGANLADTNPRRWKAKESTPEQWVRALEADHLAIAIVQPGSAMLKAQEMRDYLYNTFPRVVRTWADPYIGRVELRRRAVGEAQH
jgi:hypothetical protein